MTCKKSRRVDHNSSVSGEKYLSMLHTAWMSEQMVGGGCYPPHPPTPSLLPPHTQMLLPLPAFWRRRRRRCRPLALALLGDAALHSLAFGAAAVAPVVVLGDR